jgi:hypothetical protein
MPQAAATGEHVGVWLANFLTNQPYNVVTDCAGVVASKEKGPLWATGPDKPYGAIWALIRHTDLQVTKTKAHRTLDAATAASDTSHYWGNWLADKIAKAAAEQTRFPKDKREAHQSNQWKPRAVLKAKGILLAKWLPPGSKGRDPPRTRWTQARWQRSGPA